MSLELHSLEKRFGATIALSGVDFAVAPGEVHALIGENGAGKSTLLNIVSGLIRPDAGGMTLNGDPYRPDGPADARRRGIAHIHQELALCRHLSVAENILMSVEPSSRGWLKRPQLYERASELLEQFGRGEIDPRKRTGDLSLPDQQIVEICRALAWDARIILMDEPTSSLQRGDVERLFRSILQLCERGIGVVYISHFLEEVREIATRYTVLRDGRSVGAGMLTEVADQQLIALMVGRDVDLGYATDEQRTRPPHPAFGHLLSRSRGGEGPRPSEGDTTGETPALHVRNLASPPRLVSASFDLYRGEILGIAGLIGSGRTELVRALFGLTSSTGSVIAGGREIARGGSASRIHNGIGYLSEDRKAEGLGVQLSIADNVTMSRFSSCARAGWIDRALQGTQTEIVMQKLRVKAAGPWSTVVRLSGGNQQKVALGRLLHQDPDILLLDEPARGIDVGSKSDIYREIAALASAGKAILIVSSYLPELFAVCDRIAVMTRGRLSPARPAGEWTPDTLMQVAIGGSEAVA